MDTRFYITTAIDYTNGAPHLGHAYEKVLADVIARYQRLRGKAVYFLTGVDQHGQKVQQSAEKQGVAPEKFVAGITAEFLALWQTLEIAYDGWAATTEESHKNCVRAILQRLWEDRDADGQSRWIVKKSQGGHYSIRQEQFLTEKERGPDGEFGPEWGQVEYREEENYYFRLAAHKEWLLALIDRRSEEGRPLVVPDFRVAELRNAVEKLEGDLCISRPKARLAWGIEFPFDADFVTYVWFDALVNYISFAPGYDPVPSRPPEDFLRWWKTVVHTIGKDILIPAHGVYWPVMLKAVGFSDEEIPTLLVHGWWNIAGAKMSKSLGNSVDPVLLAERYGAEALRYYLMSDIATGKDSDFSEERLVQRFNTDLANSLGNLLNRSLSMTARYREGKLRRCDGGEIARLAAETRAAYALRMERFEVHAALEEVWKLVVRCNGFVEETAPWKLAKNPDESGRLDDVLYTLAESLRIVAVLVSPVLPRASASILEQLQSDPSPAWETLEWGGLPDGHQVGKPTPLFPRIETEEAKKS